MLPPNAFATDAGHALFLTAEQQAILATPHPSAVIAALAGTGKTTTLACKVVQTLRAAAPQAPPKVLVLACSKTGVAAFQERMRQLVRHIPPAVHVTTLERWSARQLRRRDPSVQFLTDPVQQRQLVHEALLALEAQLQRQPDARIELPSEVDMAAFHAFNRAAKQKLLLERLRASDQELGEFCEEQQLDPTMARLFVAYERGRIDHCDDVRHYAEGDCTYALAQEDAEGLAPEWERYDLIVFDEMHDLDLASLVVLQRLLRASGAQFVGAGDFNQHIEEQAWSVFQDKLHQLDDFLPRATTTLPLTQSRRFGPQIAQAVNALFPVGMTASSQRRSQVLHLTYRDDADCHAQLLQAQASLPTPTRSAMGEVAELQNAAGGGVGSPITPLTVILRHPHDACALEWALHRAGHSPSMHGLQHFYLGREVGLLLGLLVAHSMQAPDWKASTRLLTPEVLTAFVDGALYFGHGRVAPAAAQEASDDSHSPARAMALHMHHHPEALWRFLLGETHLQGGQRNFSAFGRFLQLPLALQGDAHALLTQADVWGLFAGVPMSTVQRAALRARVQAFMQAVAGMTVPQVLTAVAAMAQRHAKTLREGRGFAFALTTIAQAKGHEFAYVALPFLEPGRFPASTPHALAFLERNRLYVAMTRARHKLWLLQREGHPVAPWQS